MDPQRLSRIAAFISGQLSEALPEHADEFARRLEVFQNKCAALDAELSELLKPYAGRAFYIYHPALNYFADRYGLRQIAISGAGSSPTARELHERVGEARKDQVKVIFVQPQESRKQAEIIARAVGARIVEIDPMSMDWEANLLQTGQALQAGFDE
jgi:zinc transport system substrate-binding protein